MTNTKTQTESIACPQKDRTASAAHDSEFELLTVKELANILKSSAITIRRMASYGKIPCCRTERKILFRRSEVEAYLNRGHGDVADELKTEGSANTSRDHAAIASDHGEGGGMV